MSKKNPWILGLCLTALTLAPALQAAEASSKAAAKTTAPAEEKKAAEAPAKAEPSADKADASKDKADADKAQADPAQKTDKSSTVSHKSPALAGFLGFFPGVAIHGTGHMYAGSWMKGLGLLTIEGVTAGVMASTISSGTDDIQKVAKGLDNGKFPTDVSAAYSKIGILLVGTMAFLWSWWDDMAGAPIAAKEYNRLADEQNQTTLRLEPRLYGAQLALSTNF